MRTPIVLRFAMPVVLTLVVLAAACLSGCGAAKYGDDDTSLDSSASTTSTVATTTTLSPSTPTTVDRRATDDITDASTSEVATNPSSPYCSIVRRWAEDDPTLADAYDPTDPTQLEAAYRATADEKHRLAVVLPPEIETDAILVTAYWDRVVALFATAGWDAELLFETPTPEITATVQGDRATQNAIARINDYDARVCALG